MPSIARILKSRSTIKQSCAWQTIYDATGFVLSGYFQGKRNAEHAMAASFPSTGVSLRPGFMHGTRYVSGSIGIPLGLIGEPVTPGTEL